MKTFYFFILLLFTFQFNFSQENYTINGETLELNTEVKGKLSLLWTSENGGFRYFVKKNNTITELINSKGKDKNYLAEYKTTLSNLTNGKETESLKFRLYDIKSLIDAYNLSEDNAYNSAVKKGKIGLRLGAFGGFTNSPFVENPENALGLLLGGELEFFEADSLPRHSGILQARHAFDTDEFNYSTTEFALGYRYRLVNKSCFSVYGQVKLVTVNMFNSTLKDANNNDVDNSATSLDVPFIFGIGSDIKVGKNSYLTITYGELFAAFLKNQGNFSTDLSIGYKFNL
ncbi:hypothetical protein HNV08_03935 [Winogradskyella eckloniae]|uniref:hypothetical protein n=1 Tax=Winogradskyella eckloniae TaxID=1089306 RepID=UPI0015649977|nr:hypothetical protein [Winogradskyella eckloniae]NRD19187.1 hypothetical protein [Winogradskyella eckloniae]